jgi:uncharacterized protein (UPF0335 family)
MKRYISIFDHSEKLKPIIYKEKFKEQNLFWNNIKEAENNGFHINRKPSLLLIESVFRPDKYTLILYNTIKGIINSNQDKQFRYPELMCNYLNEKFKLFNITFENEGYAYDTGKISGINIMGTSHINFEIRIFCSPYIKDLFINKNLQEKFLQVFKELVGHELIHRGQFLTVKNKEDREKIFKNNLQDNIKYYSRKTEIMSYAWQIIEELRFQGFSNKKIINYIHIKRKDDELYPEKEILDYYIFTFRDSDILKRLYKYMYEYLEGDINYNEIQFY